jgi:hypothetical protein
MAQKCRFSQGELGKLRQDDITASFSIPILQWFTETDSGPHEGNPEAGERARVFSRDGHQDAARSVEHTSVVLAAVLFICSIENRRNRQRKYTLSDSGPSVAMACHRFRFIDPSQFVPAAAVLQAPHHGKLAVDHR